MLELHETSTDMWLSQSWSKSWLHCQEYVLWNTACGGWPRTQAMWEDEKVV